MNQEPKMLIKNYINLMKKENFFSFSFQRSSPLALHQQDAVCGREQTQNHNFNETLEMTFYYFPEEKKNYQPALRGGKRKYVFN